MRFWFEQPGLFCCALGYDFISQCASKISIGERLKNDGVEREGGGGMGFGKGYHLGEVTILLTSANRQYHPRSLSSYNSSVKSYYFRRITKNSKNDAPTRGSKPQ